MKRGIVVIAALAVIATLVFQSMVIQTFSAVGTGSGSVALVGTVEVNMVDTSISMTGLSFDSNVDTATINGETRYLFESQNDGVTAADSISFDEGNTNVAAYYYVNVTGFTSPSGTTPDVYSWVLLKDTTNSFNVQNWNGITVGGAFGAFMTQNFSATTASTVSGTVTPPSGVTATGEGTVTLTALVSSDNNLWSEVSFTLYFVTDGTTVYFDDDADMSETTETGITYMSVSGTGQQITILGNPFVLTSAVPSGTSSSFSFYFGWYTDESANTTPSGTTMSYYMMMALPFGKVGTYSATFTVTGAQA